MRIVLGAAFLASALGFTFGCEALHRCLIGYPSCTDGDYSPMECQHSEQGPTTSKHPEPAAPEVGAPGEGLTHPEEGLTHTVLDLSRVVNYNNQHSELTPPLRPPVFKRATATVDIDHVAGLISSYQIPTKHINGGCEYRAHALSALLEMDGIYSYKVWAFAPSVVSAVGTTQIEIATTYGVPVKWGFHVAVAVWSKDGHRVFDPSLDTESLSVQEWLVRFGCKECSTFVTDRANVSFYSWDGRIAAKGHSARGIDGVDFDIPTKKPVFTGAFFECVAGTGPNCQTGNWIEESLALNAAGEVLVEALSDPTLAEADAAAIRENLKSNTSLLKALEDPAPMLESVRIAKQQLIEAKGNWRRRLANAYWRRRM